MTPDELLASAEKLPATPQILPQLVRVLRDPDASSDDVVNVIKLDAGVSAQVIRLSNSSFFGFAEPTRDLDESVGRIGMQETYRLVASILSEQLLGGAVPAYEIETDALWENSVSAALAMEELAHATDSDALECYLIGLFHNVGKILLGKAQAEKYGEVFDYLEQNECNLTEAEDKILEMNHVSAAGILLRHWGFPESTIIPIESQYRPLDVDEHQKAACLMHLTHFIIGGLGLNPGRDSWAFELNPKALQPAGLTESDLERVMLDVREKFTKVKELLRG